MKKFVLFSILCFALLGAGCSDGDSSSNDADGGSTTDNKGDDQKQNGDDQKQNGDDQKQDKGDDQKQDGETTKKYSFLDVSQMAFSFSELNPAFKMDGEYIYIASEDGSRSKNVSNWVLSHDYRNLIACGFTAQIKVGAQMNYSGLQLFKKDSYDDYEFDVYGDGKFVVRDPKKAILTLEADASFVKPDAFNRLKVTTADSGNVLVYVNDNLVLTIPQSELAFNLTETNKTAVLYNVKSSASSTAPAEAWIKMEELEQVPAGNQ